MSKKARRTPKPVGWASQEAVATATVMRNTDGALGFQIVGNKLPLPSREFEAEAAWAERRFGAISLFFGKTAPGSNTGLRIVAEIRLGYESFRAFWETHEATAFRERVRVWAGETVALDGGRPNIQLPVQDDLISYSWFRATIALVSHTGTEAEISFYALPIAAVSGAIRDQSITEVPVVGILRVTTSAHELVRLLSDCDRVYSELIPLLADDTADSQRTGVRGA